MNTVAKIYFQWADDLSALDSWSLHMFQKLWCGDEAIHNLYTYTLYFESLRGQKVKQDKKKYTA